MVNVWPGWLLAAGCWLLLAWLQWNVRGLPGLACCLGCLGWVPGWCVCGCLGGAGWRVTGVCVVCVWWVAVCLVLVGYDYGGEPINIAYQFSVFWNQAGSAYPQLSTRYPQGKCVYKR